MSTVTVTPSRPSRTLPVFHLRVTVALAQPLADLDVYERTSAIGDALRRGTVFTSSYAEGAAGDPDTLDGAGEPTRWMTLRIEASTKARDAFAAVARLHARLLDCGAITDEDTVSAVETWTEDRAH